MVNRVALLGAALAFALLAPAERLRAAPVEIVAQPIHVFKTGQESARFGALEFMGGLRLISDAPLFGALSAIRFRPDAQSFVGVLDTGHWLTGTVVRDSAGRLSGVRDADISEMLDVSGRPSPGKSEMDAEGLALVPGGVAVSYEQRHRIDLYPDPGFATSKPVGRIDPLIPFDQLRHNRGLETLAISPTGSPLGGALVTVSEKSVDAHGNILAAILDGPLKGRFTVKRSGDYDATDGAFLPNGDLLLLERRFSMASSIGMRIRRIPVEAIRPGSVADGAVLIDADFSHRIDNMEGLDVISGPDGEPRIIVTSDDNHSLFQNTLMLEFRIAP
ncbi:esterase-like activity of phytase family protein [Allorhizobium borbori]|uniref:Phytase-like domain-containing protein n=1 Tax=Allorhizobium borbori TaxID=485907 RepID=A0A7W6K291_9HYPH|nr:esterase-like activity of phytase family protein [Allorhizobium borbori]MBB4103875.1 hypothetical protein [Allorhizobium borbori]